MPTMKNRSEKKHPDFPVTSLQHAMGQKSADGYGKRPPIEPVHDNMRGGGGKGKKKSIANGTAGYDVATRVNLGGKGKGGATQKRKAATLVSSGKK